VCDVYKALTFYKLWLHFVVYNYLLLNLMCCKCKSFYLHLSIYLVSINIDPYTYPLVPSLAGRREKTMAK
jgi:hypothetical protein